MNHSIFLHSAVAVVCGRGSSRTVESDGLPIFKPPEQKLQRRRWGLCRPTAPIAPEHDPGFQPSAYRPQCRRPGHRWLPFAFCADFFPPFPLPEQERLWEGELLIQTTPTSLQS